MYDTYNCINEFYAVDLAQNTEGNLKVVVIEIIPSFIKQTHHTAGSLYDGHGLKRTAYN